MCYPRIVVEKFSNPLLLRGPPFIKFLIFLGETCKKLVLLLSYPNNRLNDIYVAKFGKYMLAVMLIEAFCIFAGFCGWGIFQPSWLLGPPAYSELNSILKNEKCKTGRAYKQKNRQLSFSLQNIEP